MNERSSPSRVAGVCIRKVTLLGTEYTLSQPDKIRKAALEECVIVSRRLDMLEAMTQACGRLPAAQGNHLFGMFLDRAMSGVPSAEEWKNYWTSNWRLAFRFWNALDPSDRAKALGVNEVKPSDRKALLEGVEFCFELIMHEDTSEAELNALNLAIRATSQEELVGN